MTTIIVTGASGKKIIADTIATKSKIRCITRNTDLVICKKAMGV